MMTNDSWRIDETYVRIKGKNAYLYIAVDSDGKTIAFYVSMHYLYMLLKNFITSVFWLQPINNIYDGGKETVYHN